MKRVVVESPYAAPTPEGIDLHTRYARACVADCIRRGEAPAASHLLLTQPGVLRDDVPEEREKGIAAGLAWLHAADVSAVYVDLGVSGGMERGIREAVTKAFRPVDIRTLPDLAAAIGAERAEGLRAMSERYRTRAMAVVAEAALEAALVGNASVPILAAIRKAGE